LQVIGMPNAELVETLADEEEDRIATRCEKLGELGLTQCAQR
jgi:hypothetical protein